MKLTTLFVTIALALAAGSARANQSTLYGNEYLFPGQMLSAGSCYYELHFQADGNLVETGHNGSPVLWASGTNNTGAAYAVMQQDGNLVIYRWDGSYVWHTATYNHAWAHATIQNDGNFVVYWGSYPLWSSNTQGEGLGTTACNTSSVTSTEWNTDRWGGDYSGITLSQPKPLWCSYYCAEDKNCHAYTYVPPGVKGPNAMCFLKNTVPAPSSATGMMSGVVYH